MPALEEAFGFEGNFELAHQRLAATDYKWAFRTFIPRHRWGYTYRS